MDPNQTPRQPKTPHHPQVSPRSQRHPAESETTLEAAAANDIQVIMNDFLCGRIGQNYVSTYFLSLCERHQLGT